ncbi:MAG: glucose 1-dehydrogenase [Burkholderiaceae bacterium]|jgi:NAD(P)-dependent dehydrogenase (short-subunit alcohol dehydrogenase family)
MSKPVVLITGAITGIGRATALAFAREGARLVVSGRREQPGQALAAEIRGLGAEAEFIRADVRREEDVRGLVDAAVARFGRLDVAVNNAGTEGRPGPLTDQTAESYAETFDTNVLGTILSLKHEMRVMLTQGKGSIVNLSSTMGSRGAAGASMYVASKHAVEGLTKSAALEGAALGVRVNAVAPGPIETEMLDRFTGSAERKAGLIAGVPAKRVGTPEEIAQTIVFLASGKAEFLTGQIVGVNGGKTAL